MKKRGMGYASIFYGTGYGNGFPDESRASAELTKDGRINVYVEVSDVGSGGISVMWQIAAETLGVDKELVKIIFSNTSLIKDSGTAAASRQTYNTGNAVYDATKKLKENINLAYNKKSNLDLKEIYSIMESGSIAHRTEGYFKAESSQIDMETGQGNPYWPYTFGAQRVTVEVDDETGKIDMIEVIAVNDAGKIINPVSAEGQAEGGVAMGIGYALMEEIELNEGSIKNRNFSDYIIPTSKDIPHIETHFIEEIEETGPYGAKGIGEPVMIPTAPAILNAIYDAVGVRMNSLPVTCDRLLLALAKRKLKLNK
ncbi:molybdopterin cofactor-binding domain-containing protein [Clostridium sp.]|uniref:xanthine dehydrogenase family protein molybdopterin-binding subunit n=1 Tax=Clostridium sp. TaxID=1506 RepID=UPI0032174699